MIEAQRIQVKLFFSDGKTAPARDFVALFHRFIQTRALAGTLIDVTDYSHVEGGPGVGLIAHEANWFTDGEAGRPGLLYSRKREAPGTFLERLVAAAHATLIAARLIEQANLGVTVDGSELLVRLNDRLLAPNDPATFASSRPEFAALGARLWAGSPTETTYLAGDPRQLFSVRLRSPGAADLATLLARL